MHVSYPKIKKQKIGPIINEVSTRNIFVWAEETHYIVCFKK
jgi:hypothetical protein